MFELKIESCCVGVDRFFFVLFLERKRPFLRRAIDGQNRDDKDKSVAKYKICLYPRLEIVVAHLYVYDTPVDLVAGFAPEVCRTS